MYHFVLVHRHIDGPQGVIDFFDFGGVLGHCHFPLLNIVELLTELQLLGRGTCSENLLQIFLGLLQCFHISNVAQHLIVHTGREAVQHSTRCLFPNWEILVCRIWHYFVRAFHITLVSVPRQVLMHLVGPRCIVVSVKLFSGK